MSQIVKITARNLIRRSLTLIGVLGQGEKPNSQEANDALLTLNEIVDKWNIENLMITSNKNIEFNLTGLSEYTIGNNAIINADRPASGIINAYYKNEGLSYPLTLITNGQYNDIALKDLTGPIPNVLNYNASYPNASIKIYPISNQGSVVLEVADQFKKFDTLDDEIDLPSAYIKALRYNLGAELGIEYGRQLDPQIAELAISAKNVIKTINGSIKKESARIDEALLGGGCSFNIYNG